MNMRISIVFGLLASQLAFSVAADGGQHSKYFSAMSAKSSVTVGTTLPPVAASFRTTRWFDAASDANAERRDTSTTTRWRMWREADSITVEDIDRHIGESWQKKPALAHRKIAHDEKVVIEYQTDDARMSDASVWNEKATLLSASVLSKLSQCPATNDMQEYCGTVDGEEWKITFDPIIGLARRIERRSQHVSERIELTAVYALKSSPWQPTSSDEYKVINYADASTRENDPAVIKAIAQLR